MPTLKELRKQTTDYLRMNRGTSEFDMSVNDISRYKAGAMIKEHGKCWIGKINLYREERKREYKLTEYTPNIPHNDLKENQCNFIYNFDFAFCLPCYDKELETMINDRDKAPYTGTEDDYKRVAEITDRIERLKGVNLFWA